MDPTSQKRIISGIQPITQSELFSKEKIVFLISKNWWESWCKYVSCDQSDPGPIDNQDFFDESSLIHNIDPETVIYLRPEAWSYLYSWFFGGPQIEIFIIHGKPDLHPIKIYACELYDYSTISSATFLHYYVSSSLCLRELKDYLDVKLKLSRKTVLKLVDKSGNMRSLQGCEEMELHKANIYNETKLCLEIEDDKSDPWGALVSDIEMETYNPNITDIENEELQKAMEYSLRDYQQDSEKANTNSTGMDLKRENRRISPQCDGS